MQVRIRGIGPHEDTRFALDEKGVTTIRGASGVGRLGLPEAPGVVLLVTTAGDWEVAGG